MTARSTSNNDAVDAPAVEANRDDRIRVMRVVRAPDDPGTRHADTSGALDDRRFALEYQFAGHQRSEARESALAAHWRLARQIGRRRPQIVHSEGFRSHAVAIPAALLAGAPVIITSIGDRGICLTPRQRAVQRFLCRLADCVVVHAAWTRDWLAGEGHDPSKIVVIRKGVPVENPGAARRPGVRAELGIAPNVPLVAMRARADCGTGAEDFVDAAAIVSWKYPDARFVIVEGRGDVDDWGRAEASGLRQALTARIARLGLERAVRVTDASTDLTGVLSECAICVQPSRTDGLSSDVLGALAAGVPVVATRVGGAPEAVDDEKHALLVSPADPQGLASAMARLLDDGAFARRLGTAGRGIVRERFGMDRMIQAIERLYLDLLTRKRARPGWRVRMGLARPAFESIGTRHS